MRVRPTARWLMALLALAAVGGGMVVGAEGRDSGTVTRLEAPAPPRPATVPHFVDVTGRAGISRRQRSAGCGGNVAGAAWGDVDGDRDPDLFLPAGSGRSRLWMNGGDGRFQNRAGRAGVADVPLATGASFADYDNDGDQDLYIVSQARNRLFENDGRGRFLDVGAYAGVDDAGPGTSAAWGDYDGDGRLDLYVVNGDNCRAPRPAPDRLYRNVGDGRFVDRTEALAGGPAATEGVGLQAAWIDYDRDGDLDLYLANDELGFRANVLWRNDGSSPGAPRFKDVSDRSGAGLAVSSMGIGIGDLDGDGRTDLAVSDEGTPWALLARGATFERARLPFVSGPEPITWGLAVADLNGDGSEDLVAAAGALGLRHAPQPDLLYLGDGRGGFTEVGGAAGAADPGRGRGVALADYDRDGRLDVLVARLDQPPLLLRNRGPRGGDRSHWLELALTGTLSSADACGARLGVTVGSETVTREVDCGSEGLGSASDRVVHFGLGLAARYRRIAIRWPSGTVQRLPGGRSDRLLEVTEPRGGSSPSSSGHR